MAMAMAMAARARLIDATTRTCTGRRLLLQWVQSVAWSSSLNICLLPYLGMFDFTAEWELEGLELECQEDQQDNKGGTMNPLIILRESTT